MKSNWRFWTCIGLSIFAIGLAILAAFLPVASPTPTVIVESQGVINRFATVETGVLTVTERSNLQGPVTAGAGLTVTAGAVDFPTDALALIDVNFSQANITTVCATGCRRNSIASALANVTGNANAPQIALVMPGAYTSTTPVTIGDYEYVVGFGRGITRWILANTYIAPAGNGGISNLSISGGTNSAGVLYTDAGGGTFTLDNVEIRETVAPGNGATITVDTGSARIWSIQNSTISATSRTTLAYVGAGDVLNLSASQVLGGASYDVMLADNTAQVTAYWTVFKSSVETITSTASSTVTVCLSPMQKALGATITNNCTNPANPTLP